jgi:hypothetical protein
MLIKYLNDQTYHIILTIEKKVRMKIIKIHPTLFLV